MKGLEIRGVEVLTTKDSGMLGESDENQIAFAKKKERVIFTQDEDFLRLHAQGFEHSGIIYAHQRTPIGKMVRGLMLIYQVLEFKEMKNHIEFYKDYLLKKFILHTLKTKNSKYGYD